jgi:hypothetical protein
MVLFTKQKNWQWNHGSVGFDVNMSYNQIMNKIKMFYILLYVVNFIPIISFIL